MLLFLGLNPSRDPTPLFVVSSPHYRLCLLLPPLLIHGLYAIAVAG